jgi:hypothetical protein
MSVRGYRRLGWSLFALTVLLVIVMVRFSARQEEAFDTVLYGLLVLALSGVGALIVSRHSGNAIGWIFLALGVSGAFYESAEGWSYFAGDRGLPAAEVGEWIISWSWIVDFAGFALMFLLFPDGRLPGRRWRVWVWVLAVGVALALPGQALNAELGSEFRDGVNPFAVEAAPTDALLYSGLALMVATLGAGVASLVVRFRRGGSVERQQLKWMAFAASALFAVGVWAIFLWYESVLVQVGFALVLLNLPVAAGIAIFKYRLYDIDVVINRTLVYGALTATLVAAYLGSVLLLQLALSPLTSESDPAIAGSTLAVAALFRPLRSRIQAVVDRRFYRRRYDAVRTLESFGARLRDEVELDSLSADVRTVIADTVQPTHVSLWLRAPSEAGR